MIAIAGLSPAIGLLVVATILVVAAAVKGTLGLGMPVFSVSLLGGLLDPHAVLALMVVPVLASNLWQALQSGYWRTACRRFWPMIVCFAIGTAIGGYWMARIDPARLLTILGVIAIAFALVNLIKPDLRLAARHRNWVGAVVGGSTGVVNGLSTVNGPPLLMYLVACGLDREEFVGAYGVIALAGAVPLAATYAYTGVFGATEAYWSTLALLPVFAGLWLGRRLRRHIQPEVFRRVLLVLLMLLGANLIRRGLYA
ncbi:sulfite exporter TauE/SafE family protein [Salinisphaera hydrothermalis]|nr:sulfite exporter TauE/SafE family protein [Salinisphaera hydrothermalis]